MLFTIVNALKIICHYFLSISFLKSRLSQYKSIWQGFVVSVCKSVKICYLDFGQLQ